MIAQTGDASAVRMSGSGSAVYGLFGSDEAAQKAAATMNEKSDSAMIALWLTALRGAEAEIQDAGEAYAGHQESVQKESLSPCQPDSGGHDE